MIPYLLLLNLFYPYFHHLKHTKNNLLAGYSGQMRKQPSLQRWKAVRWGEANRIWAFNAINIIQSWPVLNQTTGLPGTILSSVIGSGSEGSEQLMIFNTTFHLRIFKGQCQGFFSHWPIDPSHAVHLKLPSTESIGPSRLVLSTQILPATLRGHSRLQSFILPSTREP